ncbi:MAG: AsmA family protein [Syntrophaceae bacterium PtaU1.Bin231]|nr:MAG: AsmA family protein [Syntrophaceae bacterium PtaU1.Bin231]
MGRFKKWVIGAAVVLFLFTAIGFFVVPPFVKSYLLDNLSQQLRRKVIVSDVGLNPFTLTLTLKGLEIKEPPGDKTFVSLGELVVNLDIRSIFKRSPIIEELAVRQPYIHLVRNPDNTYNFSDLLALLQKEEPKDEKKEPFQFSVSNIVIENGRVEFDDRPFKTMHEVREIQLGIPFISNIPEYVDSYVQPRFAAVINGDPYILEGKTKIFKDTRETFFNILIEDLDLPFYLAYIPHDLNISVPSGKLDVHATVTFSMSPDRHPAVSVAGNAALKDFALQDREKSPVARFKRLDVVMTALEPFQSKFHFAKIALDSPELNVRRDKSGTINLLTLMGKQEGAPPAAMARPAAPAGQKPLPTLILDEFELKGGRIAYRDDVPAEPVSSLIQDLSIRGEQISTLPDSRGKLMLSMDLNKGRGSAAVSGPIGLNPIFASLEVDLKRIRIRPFQEYFTDKFRVNFTDGDISAKGTLSAGRPPDKDVTVKYEGNLLLGRVATVDKVNGDDFVKFKSLFVNSVSAGYNPLFVRIKDIAIADFFARIIVNEDGTLNVKNVAKPETAEGEEAEEAEAAKPGKKEEAESGEKKEYLGDILAKNIEINRISLQNGTLVFDDRKIKPNFSSTLTELTGRVTGVTSITTKPAEVDIRGKIGRQIPMEITGKVHPFKDNLFVDLKASLRDFNLSPLTPYSGTYAGYKIEKGSLSFDLKYLISDMKLDAENKVVIDQLTLGDRVESPQATKLPVGLAVTLLRDADGKINLDIPVTGRIDDPEFSVWRIVLQVIVNLLTKVATAPFALLGSLFGGGEELSYIEFDAGSAVITEPNLKKVETLVKALKAKPALRLDIVGGVDLERDREGLIRHQFERKLKAQKMNDLIRKGEKVESVDAITLEPQEYDRYLKRAYGAEKFPKPRNLIGLEKSLPNEEMEKLMMTHIVVKDDDLRLLATKRAETVADAIRSEGSFDAGRVFVVEPRTLQPEDKKDVRRSRVDFRLK